jgi:membrane protein implicated in regulation of membrane protease activity
MDLTPHGWHLWLLAGIAAFAIELHFGNLVLVWFGVGALAGALASALGLPIEAQLLAFTVLSCALFAGSRTLFKRLISPKADRIRHGEASLVGEEARVAETLSETAGAVRIHGELWAARSLEGAIAEGESVQVERVDGLKLYVRRTQAAIWAAPPPAAGPSKDEDP